MVEQGYGGSLMRKPMRPVFDTHSKNWPSVTNGFVVLSRHVTHCKFVNNAERATERTDSLSYLYYGTEQFQPIHKAGNGTPDMD